MAWIKLILGLWLIASPWVFGVSEITEVLWNSIIVGAIFVILALVKFFGGKESSSPTEATPPPSGPPEGGEGGDA